MTEQLSVSLFIQNIERHPTIQQQKQSNLKMDQELEQTLLQRRHTSAQQIKEMDIKITMRYHFTPIRMATVKKNNNRK